MRSQSKRRFWPEFKKATFIVVSVSVVIAQANAHHFPSHQKWAKFLLVSLKTFVKSAQNRLLSSKFAQKISAEWAFLKIGQFCCKFVSKNPTKFWLFFRDLQRPCFMDSLRNKSSWPGHLFFSLSPHFFSFTNVNNVQSWPILFKKSEGLNHIKSVKERTKCPVIQGFDRLTVDRPLFEAL